MRSLFLCVITLLLLAACAKAPTDSVSVTTPQTISLNSNWQFQRLEPNEVKASQGPERLSSNSNSWQTVHIPHTPKIEPLVVNDQWQGIAVYKKQLDLSGFSSSTHLSLKFEAAMNVAEVWLEGEFLGKHLGGYLPFSFDISRFSGKKNLELVVRLDNQDNWITGPKPLKVLDFNTYGGLYRDVNLVVKNQLHITDPVAANQPASGGVFITTVVKPNNAIVNIKTHVANQSKALSEFNLKHALYFKGQLVAEVASQHQLEGASDNQFANQIDVQSPMLWHPQHPHLYTVKTQVIKDDDVIDHEETRIGIREFRFNEQHQLLINGEVTFLRGVNRHQEYPHVGYATSPQADKRDAVKIKSAGFDYVRLSHYPHSKAFMEAADELGLVLIDAVLGWQYFSPFPEFQSQIYQTCRDLIRRDRNHASVLAWECSLNESWMTEDFISNLHNIVKQELPGAYSAGWQKGYDVYLQARQHRLGHFEEPNQPYNVSEYGDWEYYAQNAGLAQDAWADLKEDERTSRQLLGAGEKRLLQQATNIQEAHNDNLTTPAYSDGYWAMFDYNRGYADDLEASGLASIYRVPKFAYYFFQSQRSPEQQSAQYQSGPMVYIASDWTAKSSLNVRVFSNSEKVELWLNGRLIGVKTPERTGNSSELEHPPLHFDIPNFEAGQLTAKAFIGDQMVAEHKVSTPGEIAKLKLRVDDAGVNITANDVVFAHAHLTDDAGTDVGINGREVLFHIEGDAEVVNPEAVVTEKGIASVLLKLNSNFNGATLRATLKGNPAVSAQITLKK